MPSCTINNRELHYLDQGSGFPLLLGHSFLWDSRVWAPQLDLLSQHFRCIVPDLWSHGQSQTASEGDLSIVHLAEVHHQLMQTLEIDRYSVLGMATGGLWGAKLAMMYPDEVASLTLIACSLDSETAENREDYLELFNIVEQLGELPTAVVDAVIRIFFSPVTQKVHPALAETFRFDLMCLSPEQVAGITSMGKQIFTRPSMINQLSDIRCPTLILAGQNDIPNPLSELQEMHHCLPGSQFAIIENAGHMLTLEQPDQVNQLLGNFLASIDGVQLDSNQLVFV
ncbi:alpha/beta fold hydrolase [Amphritea japonica]|nr:alpha/beta hydrolase [Amphritea japonica]